jgi:hypothetical protein
MILRDFQVQLNTPTEEFLLNSPEQRGQIYAPVGSGKTVCFIELIKSMISLGKTNIAVVHPRIVLSQDQLRRFNKEIVNVTYTSFHSGVHIAGINNSFRGISTTNDTVLKKIIQNTDQPHITFSSYQSFDKLSTIKFDLVICDEAHTLVQPQYVDLVKNINADKILFYTATPISEKLEGGALGGMGDYSIFGDIVAYVAPTTLIPQGYVLAPMIHLLNCQIPTNKTEVDVVDVVACAYVEQYNEITSTGMPYHQMLVTCRDVANDLRTLEAHVFDVWNKIKQLSNGKITDPIIYTVDANGTSRNGIPRPGIDRSTIIEEIKSSNHNVILAHYDTLAEGIDVSTLTGAVLMRDMNKAKIIQTIGRCARPYENDLDPVTKEPNPALFDLEKNIDLRAKPRCIITLPVVNGVWIANKDSSKIAEAFILCGYDELTTYMHWSNPTPKGKLDDDNEFGNADNETFNGKILSYNIDKQLEQLRKFFVFED